MFALSRNALGVEKHSIGVRLATDDNLCSKVCPRAQIGRWGFLSRTITTKIQERWKLDIYLRLLKGYRSDRSMKSLDLVALSLILIGPCKVI